MFRIILGEIFWFGMSNDGRTTTDEIIQYIAHPRCGPHLQHAGAQE